MAPFYDPKRSLRLLTWNVGSASSQRSAILDLLLHQEPHLVFLQECKLSHGACKSLSYDLRSLGYAVIPGRHDLCTLVRHGLNAVQIRNESADSAFRVQRLAVQLGTQRILIRHRHAHSGSPARRAEFNEALSNEPSGDLFVDIGDFNELPALGCDASRLVAFPSDNTYRHSTKNTNFITCIDGGVLSRHLVGSAETHALSPVSGTQHRPVLVDVGLPVGFQET